MFLNEEGAPWRAFFIAATPLPEAGAVPPAWLARGNSMQELRLTGEAAEPGLPVGWVRPLGGRAPRGTGGLIHVQYPVSYSKIPRG